MSDTLFPDLAARPARTVGERREPRGFVIRTDGAARGNPGSGVPRRGAVSTCARPDARDHRAVPDASISDFLGVQTNNVAEYTGVVRALELARELGAREVHLLLDSKLIVEQLAGRWRVKDAKLIPLWSAARGTLAGFDRWTAAHVPRAQNSVADRAGQRGDRPGAGGRAGLGRPATGRRVRVTGPNRRDAPGSWPRDRPVRWRALGRNRTTFLVTTLAFVVQFALVIPMLAVPGDVGDGWLRIAVALVWGLGTLWAAWCWITARTRSVLAPAVTGTLIWLALATG